MARLIMWNVITLDGYFEKGCFDLSFHENIWGEELEELSIRQLASASYLAFGRKTYEGMAAYWANETGRIADMMNSIPKLVFSRTLEKADWNNSILIKEHALEKIAEIKASESKDIYLFGSACLASDLLKAGQFDLLRIGIAPVILGRGNPLFRTETPLNLKTESVKILKNGGVIVDYIPLY